MINHNNHKKGQLVYLNGIKMKIKQTTPSPDARSALLAAASVCFAKKGFEATSLRWISSTGGKDTALIFYYFKNKEGLYREVITQALNQMITGRINWNQNSDKFVDIQAQMYNLIRTIIGDRKLDHHSEREHLDAHRQVILNELNMPHPEVQDLMKEWATPWLKSLQSCICTIRPDFVPSEVNFLAATIHNLCLEHGLRAAIHNQGGSDPDSQFKPEDMAHLLAIFCLQGLLNK